MKYRTLDTLLDPFLASLSLPLLGLDLLRLLLHFISSLPQQPLPHSGLLFFSLCVFLLLRWLSLILPVSTLQPRQDLAPLLSCMRRATLIFLAMILRGDLLINFLCCPGLPLLTEAPQVGLPFNAILLFEG